ncbi:50S ribosomal protein L14e [Tardisphaera miroshnichenkoae]
MRIGVPHKGEVCVITAGRRSGKKCVVLKPLDTRFVYAAYADKGSLKTRVFNLRHVQPTGETASFKDEEELLAILGARSPRL